MSDDDMGPEFPGAPQQVEFWSLEVPPNQTVVAKLSLFPGTMEIAHVTSAALDEKAKPGRHVVKIIPLELDGTARPEVALGTLELGRTDHFAVDFGFSSNMGFRHTGKSTVFLSGYMTRSYGDVDDEYESESEEESEEESESESESDDEEEAPGLVPLQQNGKVIPVKGASRAAAAAANGAAAGDSSSEGDESEEGESDEDDEGEEGDGDMMGDEYDRRLGAKSFGGGSSSSDEDEEDEEESGGDPLDIDSDDLVAGVEYADVEAEEAGESSVDEDESSDDEGEEEDESEEGEDDSSEEEEPQQPAAKGKRTGMPLTPQPPQGQAGKKQKGQDGKPVPASAPAKGPVAKTGGADGAFLSALVKELKQSGSLSLSALATKVKRPEGVSAKYKAFLVQHGDTFKIDGETVSLQK